MTDIFISYASQDKRRANDLASALEQRGWSVFWDRRIPIGENWRSYIGRALDDARSVVVAWSQVSVRSDWVIEEADEGKQRGVLVQVLLDRVDLPLGFRNMRAADLTDWQAERGSEGLDELVKDIQRLLGPASRRALIVENEVVWLATLKAILERMGFAVSTAGAYPDAVGLLKHVAFDVTVVDLQLADDIQPVNLFGVFLLEWSFAKRVPTIIVTGHATPPLVNAIFEEFGEGVYQILQKATFDRKEFARYVEQATARPLVTPEDNLVKRENRREKFDQLIRQALESEAINRTPREQSHLRSFVDQRPSRPLRIFYSYSHKDEALRDRLEINLRMLQRQGLITTWYDREITAGDEWKGKIDKNLEAADIILLLVSAEFISSDYCYDVEVRRALERHASGNARVIPVILRDVDWQSAPFGKLQALPKDGKAVTLWKPRDSAWKDVVLGIRRVVEELRRADH